MDVIEAQEGASTASVEAYWSLAPRWCYGSVLVRQPSRGWGAFLDEAIRAAGSDCRGTFSLAPAVTCAVVPRVRGYRSVPMSCQCHVVANGLRPGTEECPLPRRRGGIVPAPPDARGTAPGPGGPSGFERGDINGLRRLENQLRGLDREFKIFIVQPGVSRKAAEAGHLESNRDEGWGFSRRRAVTDGCAGGWRPTLGHGSNGALGAGAGAAPCSGSGTVTASPPSWPSSAPSA